MVYRYTNLNSFKKFKKQSDLYLNKTQAIIIKKIEKKPKNKNKKVKPKIMNSILIDHFIFFCLYKSQKLIYSYQNIMSANNLIKIKNKFNLIYFHYCLKSTNKNRIKIDFSFSKFI